GTRGRRRIATPPARGAGGSNRVPAGPEAARASTGEGTREKGSPRLRAHWRGIAVETFRGLNLCKSGGGRNGIRTPVSALRWPRPGPLDDGAGETRDGWLGEEDSNPRYRGQNPASYR